MGLRILPWLAGIVALIPLMAMAWQDCLERDPSGDRFQCLLPFEAINNGNLPYELELADAARQAGNYAYAAVVLERLTQRHPEHAGARLDLAILSMLAGDNITAAEQLNYLASLPERPPVVTALIRQLEQRLNPPKAAPKSPSTFSARLGVGYDDNPNLGIQIDAIELIIDGVPLSLQPDDSLSPNPRPYLGVGAEYGYEYSERGRIRSEVSVRQYEGLSDQDTLMAAAQIEHRIGVGRYVQGGLSDFRMRDGLYLTRAGAGLRQFLGGCQCYSVGASVDVMDGSESAFRSERGKVSAEVVKRLGRATFYTYGAFSYHRQSNALWGDTYSVQAGVDGIVDLAVADGTFGISRYNSYDENIYSPLFGDSKRDLIRNQVRLGLARNLTEKTRLYLDWSYVDQDSSIPLYSYNRGVAELGLRVTFW